ncbi:dihydroxyacetone kinase [Aaosphaeria arxii CBS 175.79]|uniref:Dihydroxyacetone kinase n=1 Tax=Aaosphaeria arxii CBS 175.79 TaxID=1450172 RepID=A0A6A5X8M1_9PLEO|nr:dihydroxyacetone kinase [Aaosphaeria arxii CBS 175.79]KAF2009104.1 dihydroxyacetone kinase [Aaosphaeria arxii CBS 175.79]
MVQTFYDDSDILVVESLESLVWTKPGLSFDKVSKETVLWENKFAGNHVALVAGGGAGHEPAHAGYVGNGMLTAAVSGSVFASPSVAQIFSGIKRIATPRGVLLIIKNYTGDMLHFYLAAEKARASLGIPTAVLVVGDDVAVGRKKSGKVGRRGLAGTVLVEKILGAYSLEVGTDLDDLLVLGKQITENLATIGASLQHVQIPGREPLLTSNDDQVEIGMGIHNEPGSQVLSPRPALAKLIDGMLDQLLNEQDDDKAYVQFSHAQDIVLLVNNLGGVSQLEFGGITTTIINSLAARSIKPIRILFGTYMTSLNGLGFSITLLNATRDMLKYIDVPTDAPGWIKARFLNKDDARTIHGSLEYDVAQPSLLSHPIIKFDWDTFSGTVTQACTRVIDAESRITYYDTIVGDGDCGITLARGAKSILTYMQHASAIDDIGSAILGLTDVIEQNMDGTSGALYGIFFAALAGALRNIEVDFMTSSEWIGVATTALGKLQQATPARQGDRTMMDALEPFIVGLSSGSTLPEAVDAARRGVEATKGMQASLGRAVYVESKAWELVPDPGAVGVLCILEAILESIHP